MSEIWRLAFWGALAGISLAAGTEPAAARGLPVVEPAMSCSTLAESDLDPLGGAPTRIVTAQVITPSGAASYCDVHGYVAPQVRFELQLPMKTWTQRLMFSGCGGYCGRVMFRIRAADGNKALAGGEFALVTSDLGHDTPDGNADTVWAAAREGKIDYGYRAVHVVTVAAKAIAARFYGRPQAYSYFNGCSDGGREALMEVQRYPLDYNGVIAGAAVINDTANNTIFHAWVAQHLWRKNGSAIFTPGDLAVLHKAALAACDKNGDGVIGDPLQCHFDPEALLCRQDQTSGCLTAEQVADVKAIYRGPLNVAGQHLYYGRPVGSELDWYKFDVAQFVRSFVKYMATDKIQPFDLWSMGYDTESLKLYNANAAVYNALNPDIRPFRKAGGKLIMWHGWADPGVPTMSSVGYYDAVRRIFGEDINRFVRLYLLPGVEHCGGGNGPSEIDLLQPMMSWVEDGAAPGAIDASRTQGGQTIENRTVNPYTGDAADERKH